MGRGVAGRAPLPQLPAAPRPEPWSLEPFIPALERLQVVLRGVHCSADCKTRVGSTCSCGLCTADFFVDQLPGKIREAPRAWGTFRLVEAALGTLRTYVRSTGCVNTRVPHCLGRFTCAFAFEDVARLAAELERLLLEHELLGALAHADD